MKILYSIQGTGNGHISRAKILIPILKQYADVDVLISGGHSELTVPFPVKFKFHGLGFYFGKKGGIDMSRTFQHTNLKRFYREIKELPVIDYDAVLNDFEPVSAWAARKKGVLCLAVSHQSALLAPSVPKPDYDDFIGEMILKNYAPHDLSFSFHFKKYGRNIYLPLIRKSILNASPTRDGYYLVYLPAYSDKRIIDVLSKIPEIKWKVFSKHSKEPDTIHNVDIHPISEEDFTNSLIHAEGVLCGAGFETPAEAMHLGKKLMVIPMKNQYEQMFNAEALKEMQVPVIKSLKAKHLLKIRQWIDAPDANKLPFKDESLLVVEKIITTIKKVNNMKDYVLEM